MREVTYAYITCDAAHLLARTPRSASGHIPHAVSLPRKEFASAFARVEAALRKDTPQRFVVYCSDVECDDALALLRDLLLTAATAYWLANYFRAPL